MVCYGDQGWVPLFVMKENENVGGIISTFAVDTKISGVLDS